MMPVLLLLQATVVVTLGTDLFLFCMRRCLFASCFDRLIVCFLGIVAVGGRRGLGHCWKRIPILLLPLMGQGNGMMLLDRDWKGLEGTSMLDGDWKGCRCWMGIGRDIDAGWRLEGTSMLDGDWKGRWC